MKPPGPVLRIVLKAPNFLYRCNVGWLLGHRFVQIEHTGRRSGAHYVTVVEVLSWDRGSGEVIIMSGWGPTADWYRNIHAGTPTAITFTAALISGHSPRPSRGRSDRGVAEVRGAKSMDAASHSSCPRASLGEALRRIRGESASRHPRPAADRTHARRVDSVTVTPRAAAPNRTDVVCSDMAAVTELLRTSGALVLVTIHGDW